VPQGDLTGGAVLHGRATDRQAARQDLAALERIKAPAQQVACGAVANRGGRRRGDDHHQAAAVAFGRAEEVVAGLAGKAGLDPVGTVDHAGDRIVVVLRNVAVAHPAVAEVATVERGVARGQGLGENREVARAGVGPPLVGPSVGCAEMGVAHAELGSMLVHELEPGVGRAGRCRRERHRAVVGRDRGHAEQQFAHAHPVARLEEHRRALARPQLGELEADRHLRLGLDLALLDQAERGVGGHHFGDRSGHEAPVGLAREQRLAARQVDEQDDRESRQGTGADRRRGQRDRIAWRRGHRRQQRETHRKTRTNYGKVSQDRSHRASSGPSAGLQRVPISRS
jgi:hypothetical protein